MYNFTKIVASIGPKSDTRKVIHDMVVAGADLFRINFSHDTGAVQGRKIDLIRDVAAEFLRDAHADGGCDGLRKQGHVLGVGQAKGDRKAQDRAEARKDACCHRDQDCQRVLLQKV